MPPVVAKVECEYLIAATVWAVISIFPQGDFVCEHAAVWRSLFVVAHFPSPNPHRWGAASRSQSPSKSICDAAAAIASTNVLPFPSNVSPIFHPPMLITTDHL